MVVGQRDPRAERVERGRREAGDARDPVGGDRLAGLAVGMERVGDLVQAHHRRGLADRQVEQVADHAAAERRGLTLLVDHAHRHQRAEPAAGVDGLGAGHQPGADRAGDRGQDDVVDGAPVHPADLAVVLERRPDEDHAALLGGLEVERVLGGRAPVRQRGGDGTEPARGVARRTTERRGRAAGGVDRHRRLGQHLGDRAEHQSGRALLAARCPALVHQLTRAGVDVEQDLADVDGRAAVDEDLVGLREQGDAAALQPLDEVHLPQRPGAVQPPRHDPGDQLAELVDRARAGQRGATHVVGEVEVRVVHPDRVGEPAGHLPHHLAVARHERDPVVDVGDQAVVVEARELPGSKISTVALCIGVRAVSRARTARSLPRKRSVMFCRGPRGSGSAVSAFVG